jgi:site-specific DNA-methyltransferase (adenine-specific)
MLEINKIYLGDCLEVMKEIDDQSIDMIICDLPYGVSACSWDSIIPFEPLWIQYKRIIKDNGAIVLTASQPFTSALVMSNVKMFKYEWIWEKSKGCNFTHAKNMPIKFHENVLVFSNAPIGHEIQLGQRRMKYNPQGLLKTDKKWSRPTKYDTEHKLKRESHSLDRIIEFENYPKSLLKYGNSDNNERGLHPTQKPVALFEYLIKTYSNKGDLILDNCAGSGTTGIACRNTSRNYILIEKEEKYFQIAEKRIEEHAVERSWIE